jgi:hypothetical protein
MSAGSSPRHARIASRSRQLAAASRFPERLGNCGRNCSWRVWPHWPRASLAPASRDFNEGSSANLPCIFAKSVSTIAGLLRGLTSTAMMVVAGSISRSASTRPRLKADARRKKKPLPIERGQDQTRLYTDPYQAALLKTFFMPACIGAAISVVSFCAMPVRCRACSANASACLRACSADNSTNVDGDFTPST